MMWELPALLVQRELQEQRVIRERPAQWGLPGSPELPVQRAPSDLLELLVQQAQQD